MKRRVTTSFEIEAKFCAAGPDVLEQIAELRSIDGYALRSLGSDELTTVYHDTATLSLARSGIALRARHSRQGWEVTAKWSGRVHGTVHQRSELTVVSPAPPERKLNLPEGALRDRLAALVAGRPLRPLFVTRVQRTCLNVLPRGGDTRGDAIAEIALDRVQILLPHRRRPQVTYCEVEIELRGGHRTVVTSLGRVLRRRFALTPSTESKFARGLAVVASDVHLGEREELIEARDSVASALQKIARKQLRQIREHDFGARVGDDPEELHEFRVAVRRLRAALRQFGDAFGPTLRCRMMLDLRWIGQRAGAVRDLDVQLARFETSRRHRLPRTLRNVRAERDQHQNKLRDALESSRYFRLLRRLEDIVSRPAADQERIARSGHFAVKRALRRVLRTGRHIGAHASASDLHDLRIRARRLRYLLEFLGPITGKAGRRLVRRLTLLQDLLGSHNDAAVGAALLERFATQAPPEERTVLERLIALQHNRARRARKAFGEVWEQFDSRKTLRDARLVFERLRS